METVNAPSIRGSTAIDPRRKRLDHPRRVPQPIDERRRVPEQRQVLLQIDADAAEEHALVRLTFASSVSVGV